MAAAPAIVTFVSGTPKDAVNTTMEMYEITETDHLQFTIPALDFRGTPTGIDIRKVVELGITPRINTGIAHRDAGDRAGGRRPGAPADGGIRGGAHRVRGTLRDL